MADFGRRVNHVQYFDEIVSTKSVIFKFRSREFNSGSPSPLGESVD